MKTTMKARNPSMKRGSTLFLRMTVIALGLMALGLCFLILPEIHDGWTREYPDIAYLKYPVLLILSATVVPFFVALYQTWKLLDYIDMNRAFSSISVKSLAKIKYSAIIFSGLYAVFMPIIYLVAQQEDAPGLVLIGTAMTAAPIAVAVFAAVLQMLLRNAIDIKSENDLTV